jgi:hypothetical protein
MTAVGLPAGGTGLGKVAARGAVTACGTVLALILLFAAVGGQSPSAPAGTSGGVNTAAIPAAYVPWVLAAGSMCTAISPAVIAAQDQVESGWNQRVRPAPAWPPAKTHPHRL